jgi:hypothetical protein
VDVLEHDEERRLRADPDEQVGDRGVESVPLGVGVSGGREGQSADARLELGKQTRQLAAGRAEASPESLGVRVANEVLERGREGAVRLADDRVAVAVEDGGALVRQHPGELSHEAALAGARLAGDERRATALAGGPREESPQRGELVGPSGERESRRQPERPR